MKIIELEMFKNMKGELFIQHIQKHLDKGDKVICKICGKDVDTIAEEELIKRFEELQPIIKRLKESSHKSQKQGEEDKEE